MAVYRLGPKEIDARLDTGDDTYLDKPTLVQTLTSPLLQSYHRIREEVLKVFYRHTQFVVCSIIDLNIFIQAIGSDGQKLLRYRHLYDPFYSHWPYMVGGGDDVELILGTLASSCPNLMTFCIQFDEEDLLFPMLGHQAEEYDWLGAALTHHPRTHALFQLRSEVQISFQVDFSNTNRAEYDFLKGDHLMTELPLWLGRFYKGEPGWLDMLVTWEKFYMVVNRDRPHHLRRLIGAYG